MPEYEEIIKQAHENISLMEDKLKELENLQTDIQKIIEQPSELEEKINEFTKLHEKYSASLGTSIQKYLEGAENIFTNNITQLEKQLKELETEVKRLEAIDLEAHFDKHQKTLSDIFGAINSINSTLTSISKSSTETVNNLSNVEHQIGKNTDDLKKQLSDLTKQTDKQINNLASILKAIQDEVLLGINETKEQNKEILSNMKKNRIINITGISVLIILLTAQLLL